MQFIRVAALIFLEFSKEYIFYQELNVWLNVTTC